MKGVAKIFVLLLLLMVRNLPAQQLTSARLVELRKAFVETTPWEEVYLHIDREKLIAGEDVWFSIYSTDRVTGKLSSMSSIAYVEILNPWNTPIIQKRYQLTGGRGEGSFLLPDSVSSGIYTIRAYTNWMKNFFPENCFVKDVSIFNPFRNNGFRRRTEVADSAVSALNIKFYPEGGVLLNNVETKIIARCVNRFGQGVPLTGVVTDESGNQVSGFTADAYGFATIVFEPQKGKKYSVKTNAGNFSLPEAKDNGLAVTVDNSQSGVVDVRISAAGSYVLPSARKYYFVIQTNGNIDFLSEIKIEDLFTRISVPRIKFPGGVSQVSLISDEGTVMFQRLLYSDVKVWKPVEMSADSVFERRQKVTLNLEALKDGLTGISDLSITVTPEKIASVSGIKEFLLFGTEFGRSPWQLEGRSVKDMTNSQIDNFLICTRSRWFDWKDIIEGRKFIPEFKAEKDGHFLDVTIKYREPEHVDSVKYLYMAIQGKYAEFKYARKDTSGRYEFILPVDNTLRNLIIQPSIASSNMILEMKPSFYLSFPQTYVFRDEPGEELLGEFSGLSFNYQASRIYSSVYKRETKQESDVNVRKPRFYGIPEIEIKMDDYIKLPVMQEVFFELIPGVSLRSRKTGYELRIINPFNGLYYDDPALVMIDGMILNDINILANFDPELVERIEVVKTPYLIGDLVLNGIVNVVTRAGTFSNVVIPEYAAQLPYQVIEKAPVFIAPDYTDQQLKQSRIPDLRNTIFWNPGFRTTGTGLNKVDFWTSDQTGKFTIDIEGIASNGEKISVRKTITVR